MTETTETSHSGGEAQHGHSAEAGHLAHYAHQLHLLAEGVEFGGHKLHHWGGYAKEIEAAQKLARAHSQMAYDLRRMARGVVVLERLAKQGGAAGAKAAAQLPKARSALTAARGAFTSERAAVAGAEKLLRAAAACRGTAQGLLVQRIGQLAATFTMALSRSRLGAALLTTGRIAASKAFVRGLIVVGAALEGIAAYEESTAQTQAGRLTNAALGAGGGALTMANPYVAAADLLAPKGYKLSELYRGTAGAVSTIGEGLLTGDTRAMDEFHRRAMKGSYGKVMAAASEAGEYWAQKGVWGGLREFGNAISWWVSN
jgi:hypothetical protein